MPRDSNGNYSLPAGYLAVPGTTIQASQHNPPLEDLAAAMTESLPRSGSSPMTAPLRLVNGTASAPALSFNSAVGSGLVKTTNGFGVVINGVQVAEFTSGGLTSGVRNIGELFVWTGTAVPPRCVLPYGQTLLRASYPDLWAFAQNEIASGNLFYNNGNGTTTFGIGDVRGRTIACPDGMGGTDAGRLVGGNMSGRLSPGGSGGEALHLLTAAEIPAIGFSGSGPVSGSTVQNNILFSDQVAILTGVGGSNPVKLFNQFVNQNVGTSGITGTASVSGASSNTGGAAHNVIQPTILCNYALYAGA